MSAEDEDIPVYAICTLSAISPGDAKAFSLSRITETGEQRPFPIVIVRTAAKEFYGYVNSCPHEAVWLNVGSGAFFDDDRTRLRCGRHGARFDIKTGLCTEGPCEGKSLEPVALAVIGGDVCLCGVELVEDDGMPDPFADDGLEETMDIMIHPD